MAQTAYVGLGSNLGDRGANLERAICELDALGRVTARSSLYRTVPWGRTQQPEFLNAVVALETQLAPHALLDELLAIERRLGRQDGERWGPRAIDLDLLVYGNERITGDRLSVPHERLAQRAFVLVPLAELDECFAPLRDALDAGELAGVVRLEGSERAGFAAAAREWQNGMPAETTFGIAARARALATFLSEDDAVRVRIARGDDAIEVVARGRAWARTDADERAVADNAPLRVDTIKSDLVGIFHFGRPAPVEGEVLDGDRELGYIEALGIRTPIRSMGAGRLVAIAAGDDAPVEYGQPLFSIARG
ncbi:MAG TPA: 2-amino-4-hydroxy-6-hydroxymethyldihydropteridine diphosphokinase [Candidatus Cybelea sp.]|jgi:2-amino-4-hydroxy-6-hydroxymethyldihydropteridine diphosphokinase|nr:2-amino-4-hydroxy-6-hydroxymethyldihydropteridine diphosphokinase [Candidatus Cybelea sp.]